MVRDNHFVQTGDYRTFSMLIVAQSGLYVHSRAFKAYLPRPGNGREPLFGEAPVSLAILCPYWISGVSCRRQMYAEEQVVSVKCVTS
jgi:hypothetical protein